MHIILYRISSRRERVRFIVFTIGEEENKYIVYYYIKYQMKREEDPNAIWETF